MLELAPEDILVVEVGIKLYLYYRHTVLAERFCLFLAYLFITENIVFELFRYLLLNLIHRHSRSYRHNNALPDCEVGKLVLVHLVQRIYAECNQTAYYQDNDAMVVHRPFHDIRLLF